jgi:hypothetical protein
MAAPDFVQLQDAPQLAIVAALDTLLDHLAAALIAAHPEILGHPHDGDSPPVWLADIVTSDTRRLQALLHRYRAAVDQEQSDHPSHRLAPIE